MSKTEKCLRSLCNRSIHIIVKGKLYKVVIKRSFFFLLSFKQQKQDVDLNESCLDVDAKVDER